MFAAPRFSIGVPRSMPRFPSVHICSDPPFVQNLLKVGSKGDAGEDTSKFCSLIYDRPDLNGLPIWGPGNAGITVITERLFINQGGYFGSDLWHANNGAFGYQGGGGTTGTGGSSDWYWGFCFFPQPGTDANSTTHVEEVSGMVSGTDNLDNLNGFTIPAVYGVKRVRAIRISRDPTTHIKTALLYTNLPSTANADVIQGPTSGNEWRSADFGETYAAPPNPALIMLDSRWTDTSYGKERGSCYAGRHKIIGKILSQADTLAEAADFSRLVTSDGQTYNWHSKSNWRNVDDLSDDFGTGHSFYWHDTSYKATLVTAASVTGWN